MTLSIGSLRRKPRSKLFGFIPKGGSSTLSGFTLVEVILSMVILALGIVSVQRVFLGSLSAMSLIENRSQAEGLLDDKIWKLRQEILEQGAKFKNKKDSGLLLGGDRVFKYELDIEEVSPGGRLLEARLLISWGRQGMGHSMKRNFYLMVPYADWKS